MNSRNRGLAAFAGGAVLALLGMWAAIAAVTPDANPAPQNLAVYDAR